MDAPQEQPGSRLLTAEEFYRLYEGKDFELANGRVVPMPPTGGVHGKTDSRLAEHLGPFVRRHGLGEVVLNTGFILRRNPDVIRGPDQAFVSKARVSASPMPEEGFWPVAPDLVAEVISPSDSAEVLAEKLRDYLTAGVRLLWFIYPRPRRVHVFRPGGQMRILEGEDALDGEDVVPGFTLPLPLLFG
ncbi:MAG: Uma2 family endonuclease [Myxococcales bacterium]|nr:Uma2 family endonuclease [Myxococcales bacterium]